MATSSANAAVASGELVALKSCMIFLSWRPRTPTGRRVPSRILPGRSLGAGDVMLEIRSHDQWIYGVPSPSAHDRSLWITVATCRPPDPPTFTAIRHLGDRVIVYARDQTIDAHQLLRAVKSGDDVALTQQTNPRRAQVFWASRALKEVECHASQMLHERTGRLCRVASREWCIGR